jgi:hypothetical protein
MYYFCLSDVGILNHNFGLSTGILLNSLSILSYLELSKEPNCRSEQWFVLNLPNMAHIVLKPLQVLRLLALLNGNFFHAFQVFLISMRLDVPFHRLHLAKGRPPMP